MHSKIWNCHSVLTSKRNLYFISVNKLAADKQSWR